MDVNHTYSSAEVIIDKNSYLAINEQSVTHVCLILYGEIERIIANFPLNFFEAMRLGRAHL